MSKGKNKFSKEQVQQLAANKNVRMVSESTISFQEEFTRRYYSERIEGKRPEEIFRDRSGDSRTEQDQELRCTYQAEGGKRDGFRR